MNGSFFAMLARMKYINRWGLMHNARSESLSEHSLDTAVIVHALIAIANSKFNKNINAGEAVLRAIYHDASEILTGDLPTPVKYYNPEIKTAYKQLEGVACEKLLSMLPNDLQPQYKKYLMHNEKQDYTDKLIKAADKLSALIKCIEEKKMGSTEFDKAYKTLYKSIIEYNLPEVDVFINEFLPAYNLTLDELD